MKLTNKEILFVLLAVCMVLLLVIGTAFAGLEREREKKFDGKWKYLPEKMEVLHLNPDDSQFILSDETGMWSGALKGESHDDCLSVMHSTGRWFGYCTAYFSSATLNGMTGELELGITVLKIDQDHEWFGEFLITDGSGELENVHAFGTIWGPGFNPAQPEKWGVIYYSIYPLEMPDLNLRDR